MKLKLKFRDIPADAQPYIPIAALKKNASCGAVVGLVFPRSLSDEESVTWVEAEKILAEYAAKHDCNGDRPYASVIHDIKLGTLSMKFSKIALRIEPSRFKRIPGLTGTTTNGAIYGDPRPTNRYRYRVHARLGEDQLIVIDVERGRISEISLQILKDYVANNTHVQSRNARGAERPA